MSNIIPFAFSGHDVRVVQKAGEPLFVGNDVCSALGYSDGPGAIKKHCKGAPKWLPLATAGGEQKVRILTEGDVMRLIVRSKLPAAQEFESLVFDTILPTIRRTGSYNPATQNNLTAQATGGIVKAVVHKEITTMLNELLPGMVRSALSDHGQRLVADYKTANELLIEYGAHQKGRSALTQKTVRALKKVCDNVGIAPMKDAFSGKLRFPAEVSIPFFKGTGAMWIRLHNAQIKDRQPPLIL